MMYHSTCSFKCLPYLLILGCILTFLQACAPVQRYVLLSSDNGDGTYTNPVINADYPDPDIIRVGEDYYMVSSSFVAMPGIPVCHSKDQDKTFEHYFSDNSALVSNRIFTILPEVDGRIMMSTENGITCFHTKEKIFRNWTRGEGLLPAYFNAAAGTVRKNKNFVFGSTDGAIELPMNVKFPDYKFSRLVFSDFHLSYQPVYPGVKDSPLQKSIDETDVLELAYDENTFSFEVSTINYDSPGNALYSWKLEGFYEKWTQPGANNLIRFTNLFPRPGSSFKIGTIRGKK